MPSVCQPQLFAGSSRRLGWWCNVAGMADDVCTPLGWWTISGEALMEMLRLVERGEHPLDVYAEYYANSEIEDHRG